MDAKVTPTQLLIEPHLKNSGTVPAENLDYGWKVIVGGVLQPASAQSVKSSKSSLLNPGEHTTIAGGMGDKSEAIESGKATLLVYISYSFKWRGHSEKHCDKEQYVASQQIFINFGDTCYEDDFK